MSASETDPERWARLEEFLDRLLRHSLEEREAELAKINDAEMRSELRALLEADSEMGDFLDASAGHYPELLFGPLEPDTQFGPYRIVREIGRGGMGVVYEALDTRLGRRVALKFLPPGYAGDHRVKQRFLREARSASALDHPHLGVVHDIGETDDGRLYIVMAYYEGESLRERLGRGRLTGDEARAFATQIAQGLERAHEAGVVHRDIKPGNILITERGELKIVDFGLARSDSDVALTRPGGALGTPAYMAPEQARGEEAGARSDLWALGVVLYEMVAGRRPFVAENSQAMAYAILQETPPGLQSLGADVPDELIGVVDRLLQKDPQARFASATEVIAALGGSLEMTQAWSPPSASDTGPVARRRWLWAVVGALAVAGLVWLSIGVRPEKPLIYVAVAEPIVSSASGERVGAAVRAAVIETLIGLRGLATVSNSEPKPLSTVALARSLAAQEVVSSEIECRETSCQVELRRLRGEDARVVWIDGFEVPVDDLSLVVSAVQARTRSGFAEYRQKQGFEVSRYAAGDWAEYLELRSAVDAKANTAELLARLADLRHRSPEFLEAYLLETDVLRQQYHFSGVEDFLERGFEVLANARRISPSDSRVPTMTFDLAIQAERWELAESALSELETLEPGTSGLMKREAQLMGHRGDGAGALDKMRRAARLHPSTDILTSLAFMEYRRGEVNAAKATLARLLERSPTNFRALSFLAQLELAGGNVEKAAGLFEELVDISPGVTELSNLGLAYSLLGRVDRATELYRAAHALEPANPVAALNLADALSLSSNDDEADTLYQSVVSTLEESPDVLRWQQLTVRAQALAHLGRVRDAVVDIQQALVAEPENPQVAFEAALVYALVGDRTSALVNVERSLALGLGIHWYDLPWFDELREEPSFAAAVEKT